LSQRRDLEEGIALFRIFSAGLFELALLLWAVRKPENALGLVALLTGAQRPARNRDQAVKRSGFGLDHFSGFFFAVHFFDQQILPTDLGNIRGVQFAVDYRLNKIGR